MCERLVAVAMTPRERYMAVIKGELPDRAPVSPFIMQFAAQVAGIHYQDYCRSGEALETCGSILRALSASVQNRWRRAVLPGGCR